MANKYGKCALDVDSKDALKCQDCNTKFHATCTRSAGEKVSTRKSWKCDVCVGDSSSSSVKGDAERDAPILEAISALRLDLTEKWDQSIQEIKEVKEEVRKVNVDVGQLKSHFDEIKTQTKENSESVNKLKIENKRLSDVVIALKAEVNDLQQHTRKNNLLITGIPVTKNENVYEILSHLASLLNLKFYTYEISAAHRLPSRKKTSMPQPIVVCFVSRATKAEWIAARKHRRSLTADELSSSFPATDVYLNEHLTPQTREVFNEARRLVKERKLVAVWTADCRVIVKKEERGTPKRIQELEEQGKLLVSAPTEPLVAEEDKH